MKKGKDYDRGMYLLAQSIMKKPKHGGKRKGAGRPKLPPELKKEETVTMRIPKSKVGAILKALGKA